MDRKQRYHELERFRVGVIVDHMTEAYKDMTGRTASTQLEEALYEAVEDAQR